MKIDEDVKILKTKIENIEWELDNPPKYKEGDKVVYKDFNDALKVDTIIRVEQRRHYKSNSYWLPYGDTQCDYIESDIIGLYDNIKSELCGK